jgi:hypothetical protein
MVPEKLVLVTQTPATVAAEGLLKKPPTLVQAA